MIKHYITLAFRNLQRNKFQSAFSIVGQIWRISRINPSQIVKSE